MSLQPMVQQKTMPDLQPLAFWVGVHVLVMSSYY